MAAEEVDAAPEAGLAPGRALEARVSFPQLGGHAEDVHRQGDEPGGEDRRGQVILGKFAGCWLACGLSLVVFYGFFVVVIGTREHHWPLLNYAQAMWLQWIMLGVVIALVLFIGWLLVNRVINPPEEGNPRLGPRQLAIQAIPPLPPLPRFSSLGLRARPALGPQCPPW